MRVFCHVYSSRALMNLECMQNSQHLSPFSFASSAPFPPHQLPLPLPVAPCAIAFPRFFGGGFVGAIVGGLVGIGFTIWLFSDPNKYWASPEMILFALICPSIIFVFFGIVLGVFIVPLKPEETPEI